MWNSTSYSKHISFDVIIEFQASLSLYLLYYCILIVKSRFFSNKAFVFVDESINCFMIKAFAF